MGSELHTELNALTAGERSLLLSKAEEMTVDDKLRYAALVSKLKSTLPDPSIQIRPLK